MKRLLSILLLLTLLLNGCALPQAAPPTHTDSITQGGFHVTTDYSAYTAGDALSPLFSRLTQTHISTLEAREDYGLLYPFAGSTLAQGTAEGYASPVGYLYGMTDRNGRIVLDPVYSSIRIISDVLRQKPLPFWLLSRDTPFDTDDYSGFSTYAIASLDGRYVTDCIYSSVYGYDGHVIAIEDCGNSFRFDLFAPDGSLLLHSEELACADRLSYCWDVTYGEELLLLTLTVTDESVAANRDSYYYAADGSPEVQELYAYFFVDLSGEVVLGPYRQAYPFSDGRAAVLNSDDTFSFIDRSGRVVCDGYSYVESFYQGNAIVVDAATKKHLVIDTDGHTLIESEPDSYYLERSSTGLYAFDSRIGSSAPYGFCIYGETTTSYYDPDGTLLYGGPVDSRYLRLTHSGIFLDRRADGCVLYDVNSDQTETLSVEDYEFVDSLDGQDYFTIRSCHPETTELSFILRRADGAELLRGDGYLSILPDCLGGSNLLYLAAPGQVTVYDMELTPLLTIPTTSFASLERIGDRLCCTDAFSCSYYALDGTLLFRYPLINSMDD